ncbi:hypothetical protein [Crateriforma conspicua]|uniref:hypothetical protein n=1 Tax=Crateriforma TaxID=2714592 RepID=UPI0018CD095E|nr:hypothetical protein [Crateriforma conspicua]
MTSAFARLRWVDPAWLWIVDCDFDPSFGGQTANIRYVDAIYFICDQHYPVEDWRGARRFPPAVGGRKHRASGIRMLALFGASSLLPSPPPLRCTDPS